MQNVRYFHVSLWNSPCISTTPNQLLLSQHKHFMQQPCWGSNTSKKTLKPLPCLTLNCTSTSPTFQIYINNDNGRTLIGVDFVWGFLKIRKLVEKGTTIWRTSQILFAILHTYLPLMSMYYIFKHMTAVITFLQSWLKAQKPPWIIAVLI